MRLPESVTLNTLVAHTEIAVPRVDVAMVCRSVPFLSFELILEVALELARTLSVVAHARSRDETNFLRPLRRKKSIAALTTLIELRAEEGEIDGPRDGFCVVQHYLRARGKHSHR